MAHRQRIRENQIFDPVAAVGLDNYPITGLNAQKKID
jgi:hypothetical protein